MTRKRYLCPACKGVFVYDHHPSIEADPLPDGAACPHCAFVPESEYPPAVVSPHIQRSVVHAVDGMHRAMEEGANHRATVAQEVHGLDAVEAGLMRETNSRDHLRPGDTSFAPVVNDITRMMDATPRATGFSGGAAQGMALSSSVQTGAFPNAGLRAMQELRAGHAANVASTGHRAPVTSSVPALETQQPGYRKRV